MQRIARIWLAVTLCWTVFGLMYAGQLINTGMANRPDMGWLTALEFSAHFALPWIPLSVAMLAVVQRVPLQRARGLRRGLLYAAVIAAGVLLRALYVYLLNPLLGHWYPQNPGLLRMIQDSWLFNGFLCAMILGIAHGWVYAQRAQRSRLHVLELERGLTRARLDALAARLHPHFLFNALNSIAELIHQDPHNADRMLVGLAGLLRRSLAVQTDTRVSLDEELALLGDYLAIEQLRLGERLALQWQVPADCRDALLPSLILQPLVENAIVHGIARRRGGSVLRIAASADAGRLRLLIEDAAVAPLSAAIGEPASGSGLGLSNSRDRLRCLFGDDWSLDLAVHAGAGSRLQLELPLARAAGTAAVSA